MCRTGNSSLHVVLRQLCKPFDKLQKTRSPRKILTKCPQCYHWPAQQPLQEPKRRRGAWRSLHNEQVCVYETKPPLSRQSLQKKRFNSSQQTTAKPAQGLLLTPTSCECFWTPPVSRHQAGLGSLLLGQHSQQQWLRLGQIYPTPPLLPARPSKTTTAKQSPSLLRM